jgi:hypothetical protein
MWHTYALNGFCLLVTLPYLCSNRLSPDSSSIMRPFSQFLGAQINPGLPSQTLGAGACLRPAGRALYTALIQAIVQYGSFQQRGRESWL